MYIYLIYYHTFKHITTYIPIFPMLLEDIRLWYLVGTEEIDTYNTKIIDYNGNALVH